MEQKTFYVAPKAKLSAAKIRCSILVGSYTEVKPSTPSSSAGGDNVGFGDARARKDKSESLGF